VKSEKGKGERTEESGEKRSGWGMGERPFQRLGSGERRAFLLHSEWNERSPISHLSLGGLQGRPPVQLMLVCTSDEGRSRALFNDTATRVTGRSDGRDREVWMQFEPCCPDGVLDVRRRAHGEKGAADRDLSQPTGHTSCFHSCLFAFSFSLRQGCHTFLDVTLEFPHAFVLPCA
jgi:hypothetical protein